MRIALLLPVLRNVYCVSAILFFSFIFSSVTAQIKHGDTLKFKAIYDSTYGISIYDPLNVGLGGDSTRSDSKGYAVQGWYQDYYPGGKMLHKGYYINGQLKSYKNFYPNGQVEREYKMTDLSKSNMSTFYQDGKPRTNITYSGFNVIKEENYFPNGQLEYIEEYDKKCVYYLLRRFYNEDGKPSSLLELIDPKKKIYSSKEFYDNGKMKEEGTVFFNEGMGDYQKDGKWKFYNDSGSLREEKSFAHGEEVD